MIASEYTSLKLKEQKNEENNLTSLRMKNLLNQQGTKR